MIDTSPEGPFAVNSVFPSGDSAMPHGRCPASTDPATLLVAVSIVSTILLRPVDTKRCLPSLAITVPIGRMPSASLMVLIVAIFFVSISDSVAPFSDGTYARDPSGRNAIERGRGP